MQVTEALMSMGYSTVIHGIPVYFSFWTLLLAAGMFWEAKMYIELQLKHLRRFVRTGATPLILASAFGAIFMILSIGLHEMAHGLVAARFGFHIVGAGVSWWGAYVTLPDGYTEGTPWAMIAVSFAGPATNIAISLILGLIVWFFPESLFENTVQFVAYMNYRLGKLNFLPIFVLDGGKLLWGVIRLFISDSAMAMDLVLTVTVFTVIQLYKNRRSRDEIFEPTDGFERWLKEA